MNTKRARVGVFLCVLASSALGSLAHAQEVRETVEVDPLELRFVLPLEVAHGPRFDGEERGFAWLGQLSVLPALAYGGFELGALGAAAYRATYVEALFGARASFALVTFLQGTVGLRLAVQGAYAVRAEGFDGMLGAVFDLATILRIGAWAGRDFAGDSKHYYALITVGTNVLSWADPVGAVIEAGPLEDVGDGE